MIQHGYNRDSSPGPLLGKLGGTIPPFPGQTQVPTVRNNKHRCYLCNFLRRLHLYSQAQSLVTKPATIKTKYKWLWFAQAGQQDGACQMEKCLQALDQVLSRGGGKLAQAPGSLPGSWRACSSVNS